MDQRSRRSCKRLREPESAVKGRRQSRSGRKSLRVPELLEAAAIDNRRSALSSSSKITEKEASEPAEEPVLEQQDHQLISKRRSMQRQKTTLASKDLTQSAAKVRRLTFIQNTLFLHGSLFIFRHK